MKDRILPLEGVRNFRDFGGYASRHGGHVKQGRLFRSGHYAEATHGDLQQIRQKRIAVQADLRRPDERERQPGKWSAPMTITFLYIPDAMNWQPVVSAKRAPEQTAAMSNPAALSAPIFCWTMQAEAVYGSH